MVRPDMPENFSVQDKTPFQDRLPPRFQFRLGTLLVAMLVFSVMSACLLWASRLPLITQELNAWLGTLPSKNRDGSDRTTQLLFLLFCYAMPLLMATALSSILSIFRWVDKMRARLPKADDEQWKMEA
jgi:uncharacterized iron-regulated membrane protein